MSGPAYADPAALRGALLDARLLVPTSVDGVYHRSGRFEDLALAVGEAVSRHARHGAADGERIEPGVEPGFERRAVPPVVPRGDWLRTDYLRSFPDLMGSIGVFDGDDREHRRLLADLQSGADWTARLHPADVVVSSSVCHGLYGTLDPVVPAAGLRFELSGFCFRHEPSLDPTRMQSFRMLELVRVGTPTQAREHAEAWRSRGVDVLESLGLAARAVVAHDPFFGRVGTLLAGTQTAAEVKHELVVDLTGLGPTALGSVNLHEDHFGAAFGLRTEDGAVAHSACVGFGLERCALALLAVHGLDVAAWPTGVREVLAR